MASIDLNADLGENEPDRVVGDDAAMLEVVSSANVSCGFHAGSPEGIRSTLLAARDRGVTVGAHPGYRDRAGFGRRRLDVEAAVLQAQIEYQIGAVQGLATATGTRVAYVKPHGALYNAMASDAALAGVVCAAVRAIDSGLAMLCLAGSVACDVADEAGLRVVAEAFADRAYTSEGHLVARSEPGSVLHDPKAVAERVLRLATEGVVEAIDGSIVRVAAQSVCVHGDSEGAVAMARATRAALEASGVRVASFASV